MESLNAISSAASESKESDGDSALKPDEGAGFDGGLDRDDEFGSGSGGILDSGGAFAVSSLNR
jgi:hypothetical protein